MNRLTLFTLLAVTLAATGCTLPQINPPVGPITMECHEQIKLFLGPHRQAVNLGDNPWTISSVDDTYLDISIVGDTATVTGQAVPGSTSFDLTLTDLNNRCDTEHVEVTLYNDPGPISELITYSNPDEGGNVTTSPLPDDSGYYPAGGIITLTAVPAPSYEFTSWIGNVDDPATNPTTITLSQLTQAVGANFKLIDNPTTTCYLTVSKNPAIGGTVTPASGIQNIGAGVPITATAAIGYSFTAWTGPIANAAAASTKTTPLIANTVVTANFTKDPVTVDTLDFSGYTWIIKDSGTTRVDPGQNFFSGDPSNLWLDTNGLNLALRQRNGNWYCPEVLLDHSLGRGVYCFTITGRVDLLDPNLTLGAFTWSDTAKAIEHKEFDVEFSRWGNAADINNSQYAINPFYAGMVPRFRLDLTPSAQTVTCYTIWQTGYVAFRTYYGDYDFANLPPADKLVYSWSYNAQAIPAPGDEAFHFNLWLNRNNAPQVSAETVVTVNSFAWQSAVPIWPTAPPVDPGISVTYAPPAGSSNLLTGKAVGVDFAHCYVVAYIEVSSVWWVKPYLDSHLTPLNSTGNFVIDLETDPGDVNRTRVLLVLIPDTITPPACCPCTSQPSIAGTLAQVLF